MNLRTLAPQTGCAFILKRGMSLKVMDPAGGQVADLFCVSLEDPLDTLSSGRSIDYNETIYLTTGHSLFSHRGKAMLRILKDTCGCHDFLVTPCSLQMFQMISQTQDYHPSCQENLARHLGKFGVKEAQISTTFNIFMNIAVQPDGKIKIARPRTEPGDHIILEAVMDLIVGLTACSDEQTNDGACKPVSFEILPSPAAE